MKPDAVRRERRGREATSASERRREGEPERACRSDDPSGVTDKEDGKGVEEAEIVREKWRRLLLDFRRSRFRKC